MIAFERTRDLALVRELIAGDARVWDAATDDAAPAAADWQPNADERIWYVIARNANENGSLFIGLFTLLPQNAVCWEIHATRVFGSAAVDAERAIAHWIFARSGCRRLVAQIPATNRAAIRAARRAGFLDYGCNRRAFLKRGQLVDLILLGCSAEPQETTPCQA